MTETYVYKDEVMNTTDLKDQPHRMSHSVRRGVGAGGEKMNGRRKKRKSVSLVLFLH